MITNERSLAILLVLPILPVLLMNSACPNGNKSGDSGNSDCPEGSVGTWVADMSLYGYNDVPDPAAASKYCQLTDVVFTLKIGGTSDRGHALGTLIATGTETAYVGGSVYKYASFGDRFIGSKPLFVVLDESSIGSVSIDVYSGPPDNDDVERATLEGDISGDKLSIDSWSWDPTDNLDINGDTIGCHGFYFGDRVTFTRTSDTAPDAVTTWDMYANSSTKESFEDCSPEPVDTGDTGPSDTATESKSSRALSDAEWLIELISDAPDGWPAGGHMSREAMAGTAAVWLNLELTPDIVWSSVAHSNWDMLFARIPIVNKTGFEVLAGPQLLAQPWFGGMGTVATNLDRVKMLGHGMADGLAQPVNEDVRDAIDLLMGQFVESGAPQSDVGLLEWRLQFLLTNIMPKVEKKPVSPQTGG